MIFSNVNLKLVLNNKNFWRTIKSYFSENGNFSDKIMISEKDSVVSDDRRLSEIFNTRFINITKTLAPKPGIISTTKSLPKIIKLLKIILALRKFFLCEERSVTSSFIL